MSDCHPTTDRNTKLREEIDGELLILKERIRAHVAISPLLTPLFSKLATMLTSPGMDISGLTKVEAFARIDSAIVDLEKQLLTFRQLRNTLPPIASIPNEILSKVFLFCHHLDIEPDSTGAVHWKSKQQGHTRLVLSWVCHRWRATAISYADLWTFVAKGSEGYIQACLQRSKGFHLAVVLHEAHETHFLQCLSEMCRIRSLYVCLDDGPREEEIDPDRIWASPAPCVVSLVVHDVNLDDDGKASPPPFSATHPRLQHLELHDCDFRWDISLVSASTLTTLHIINPAVLTTVEDLVTRLGLMTRLTDCKLASCFGELVESPSADTRIEARVSLPSIRNLTLEDESMNAICVFLSHLDIPNSSVNVQTWVDSQSEIAEYSSIFRSLRKYLDQSSYWKDEEFQHISMAFVDWSIPIFNLDLCIMEPN